MARTGPFPMPFGKVWEKNNSAKRRPGGRSLGRGDRHHFQAPCEAGRRRGARSRGGSASATRCAACCHRSAPFACAAPTSPLAPCRPADHEGGRAEVVRGQIRGHPDELDRQPVTGGRVACYSEEATIQEQAARSRVARARSVMACGGDLAACAGHGSGGSLHLGARGAGWWHQASPQGYYPTPCKPGTRFFK